jgi:dTDP-4-dehydrorhamnose reductase
VKDLASAIQKIGDHLCSFSRKNPGQDIHDIFQVCNTGITTRYEMTKKIKEFLGLKDVYIEKLDKIPSENRPALRPRFVAMSTAHYENFFKMKLRPWQDSLKDYLSEQN